MDYLPEDHTHALSVTRHGITRTNGFLLLVLNDPARDSYCYNARQDIEASVADTDDRPMNPEIRICCCRGSGHHSTHGKQEARQRMRENNWNAATTDNRNKVVIKYPCNLRIRTATQLTFFCHDHQSVNTYTFQSNSESDSAPLLPEKAVFTSQRAPSRGREHGCSLTGQCSATHPRSNTKRGELHSILHQAPKRPNVQEAG